MGQAAQPAPAGKPALEFRRSYRTTQKLRVLNIRIFPSFLFWNVFLAVLHFVFITATFFVYLGIRCSCSKRKSEEGREVHVGVEAESQLLLPDQSTDLLAEEASL